MLITYIEGKQLLYCFKDIDINSPLSINQHFLTWTLLTFKTQSSCVVGGCPALCGTLSGILASPARCQEYPFPEGGWKLPRHCLMQPVVRGAESVLAETHWCKWCYSVTQVSRPLNTAYEWNPWKSTWDKKCLLSVLCRSLELSNFPLWKS